MDVLIILMYSVDYLSSFDSERGQSGQGNEGQSCMVLCGASEGGYECQFMNTVDCECECAREGVRV